MLNILISSLLNVGIKSNIVAGNGVGPLIFSREKQYGFFRYISTLLLMLVIIITSIGIYFLEQYVLIPFDILEFKICIVVFVAGILNIIINLIWKKSTRFGRYLYGCSSNYVYDLVYTIYVVMLLDMSLALAPFLINVVAIVAVLFVMSIIVGMFVDGINRSSLNVNFRNISARLFLFGIIALLLYYANLFIA